MMCNFRGINFKILGDLEKRTFMPIHFSLILQNAI
jgi:hypothetical protein